MAVDFAAFREIFWVGCVLRSLQLLGSGSKIIYVRRTPHPDNSGTIRI